MQDPTPIDAAAFNGFEAAGWERVAVGYDNFFAPIALRVAEVLIVVTGIDAFARVLDVATGPGYVASLAHSRGASVVGTDIATSMVALASELHPEIEFRRGDAERLPFEDASFEVVVANLVLPHLGRPEQAAEEFARVLTSGGRVALSTWDAPERARLVGVLADAVQRGGAEPVPSIPAGPPFFRFADDQELSRLLHGRGFDRVEIRTVGFTHRVASADAFWDGLLGGIVRLRALVLAQSEEVKKRIRAAFDELVHQYASPVGLELPVSVKVVSGGR